MRGEAALQIQSEYVDFTPRNQAFIGLGKAFAPSQLFTGVEAKIHWAAELVVA
jgi:hypothetical protein